MINSPVLTNLSSPLSERDVKKLRVGELVKINGQIVTARDRAYVRALELLRAGKRLPLDLRGAVIYHCGPIVRKTSRSWQILSAGATTSARLDRMQTEFAKRTGVRALIGKGGIDEEVAMELARLRCVYLAFTGGAAVLAAQAIEKVEKVLWQDLGAAEALWVLRVRNFGPLVVAIDTKGNNLYLHKKQ